MSLTLLSRDRLRLTARGLRLKHTGDEPSLAQLTSRELQIMELLAMGYSVKQSADHLSLAESTIDNHKSRLMKKLDLHKTVELTHKAIKEGLVML